MIYLLYFYFLFLAGFAVYSIAVIYHITRYERKNAFSKRILTIYTLLSVLIIFLSLIFIATLDWPNDFSSTEIQAEGEIYE